MLFVVWFSERRRTWGRRKVVKRAVLGWEIFKPLLRANLNIAFRLLHVTQENINIKLMYP